MSQLPPQSFLGHLRKKLSPLALILILSMSASFLLSSCGDDEEDNTITIDLSDYICLTRTWHSSISTSNSQLDITLDFRANGTVESTVTINTSGQGGWGSATVSVPTYFYNMNIDKKTLTLYEVDGADVPVSVLSYNVTETTLILTHLSGETFPIPGDNRFLSVAYTSK